jgi:cysteine synthase A
VATTGPEILRQTDGRVDAFICAVGSGGTLAGVAQALRAAKPGVKIGLADPMGAALYSYYTAGVLKAEGSSITEGIGQGRVTANLEGLCLGASSGVNVAGAMRMARAMGPGHVIVTILCDGGARYQSRLFNPAYLRGKGLPVPDWLDAAPAPLPTVFEGAGA